MKAKRGIYLEWVDSRSTDEWTVEEHLKIDGERYRIHTLGILISESKNAIVVALNVDTHSPSAACFIEIPKSVIRKRIDFKLSKLSKIGA